MMNKLLFIIICIILLYFTFNVSNKENFSQFKICNGFSCLNDDCGIEEKSKYCNNSVISINNVPECYFDKVVDPNNIQCIDFCVNTYTWKQGSRDNTNKDISKKFINMKKHDYFASKCNECIDKHYDRIMLLADE